MRELASTARRGKRRIKKRPLYARKHLTFPIFIVVLALAVGPAASGWVTETGGMDNSSSTTDAPTTDPLAPQETFAPGQNPGPYLSFATWNITKSVSSAVPSWAKRRLAIGRSLNESNSDVIAIQEATFHTVTGADGKRMTQRRDVIQMASEGGYAAAAIDENKCKGACVHSAFLLYKTSTIQQVDLPGDLPSAGQGKLDNIIKGLRYAKNREFGWAYFEGLNGAGKFLAVSVHLNNQNNTAGRRDRQRVGKAFTKWAEELNEKSGLSGTPVILMGDFNSFKRREPEGMPIQLEKAGWKDSYKAASDEFKFFDSAYTVEYTGKSRNGWPKKPITSKNPVRIDYIMYRGEGLVADVYMVVVRTNPDGTFDNNYRGSDHLMVQALIHFNASTPAAEPSESPIP